MTLTAWPWCWRARQRDTAGTAGGRSPGCRARPAAASAGPTSEGRERSGPPRNGESPVEPQPLTAGHPGRSFRSIARARPSLLTAWPSGVARRRCALEAVGRVVTGHRDRLSAISTPAVKVSPSPIVLAGRRRCGAGTRVACHPSLMSGALRGSPQDLASTDAGTPAILPGQAPRDRERQRLPGFTPSRPVPARLTCRALARRTGPRSGHMPCYAEALSLRGKGLYLRKLVAGAGFEPATSGL